MAESTQLRLYKNIGLGIALLMIVFSVFTLLWSLFTLEFSVILGGIILLVLLGLLVMGIRKNMTVLMIPYLVLLAISIPVVPFSTTLGNVIPALLIAASELAFLCFLYLKIREYNSQEAGKGPAMV